MSVFILLLAGLYLFSRKYEDKNKSNSERIKKLTAIAMLSSLSVVLYLYVKFPIQPLIFFMPNFLDIHFSNVPIYIAGYLLGPSSGAMVAIIRFIVKLPQTRTATVGELSDLVIAMATVLVTSILYQKYKSKNTAIWLSIAMIPIWIFTSVLSNWLIIMPFYISVYGFDAVLGMMQNVPGINGDNFMTYYLFIVVVPFNLILSSLVSLITFFTYKGISRFYTSSLEQY